MINKLVRIKAFIFNWYIHYTYRAVWVSSLGNNLNLTFITTEILMGSPFFILFSLGLVLIK